MVGPGIEPGLFHVQIGQSKREGKVMSDVKEYRTQYTPAELAEEIAEIVRTKDLLWNQGSYFNGVRTLPGVLTVTELRELIGDPEDDAKTACGSTACIAGWAAVLTSPPGAVVTDGGGIYIPAKPGDDPFAFESDRRTAFDAGREALDISYDDAGWLFSGYREKDEVLEALDAIASGEDWHAPESDDDEDEHCTCGCEDD